MCAVDLDREKFRELMLYIADKSVDDPGFGATKLNKLLFFADFLAYSDLGRPITGAEYQKLEHGPAPRHLLGVQRELEAEGAATVTPQQRYRFTQHRLTALRKPDLSVFSAAEIALVDEVLQLLRGATAVEVSRISHNWSVGWDVAEAGETIPYETAFWTMVPPGESDIEAAQRYASEHGLLAASER